MEEIHEQECNTIAFFSKRFAIEVGCLTTLKGDMINDSPFVYVLVSIFKVGKEDFINQNSMEKKQGEC